MILEKIQIKSKEFYGMIVLRLVMQKKYFKPDRDYYKRVKPNRTAVADISIYS